jgi:membrane associated rhomboid family serine protease
VDENGLLVRVLAFIAVVISVGWFISFVVVPVLKQDYQPPPEVTVAMTAIITAIAGLLGGAYYKARRALRKDEDGPDGDGNDH